MIQAKVGPNILPGSGLSDTPPDHKSTSLGCLKIDKTFLVQFKQKINPVTHWKIEEYLRTVSLGIEPDSASKFSAGGNPQNFLNSM